MTDDEVLVVLRDCEALLEGHFELRSGLHSDRFFQCAKVLRFPRLAERLCAELAARVVGDVDGDLALDAVIAPAMGGIVVGHEMARAWDVRSIFAEKQDDRLVLRRDFRIEPGQRFVVAEDVVTRGGRVQETVKIVESRGGVVVRVAVLVDRSGPMCERGLPLVHPGS
jgi:orotate phosphoribosyltransferase